MTCREEYPLITKVEQQWAMLVPGWVNSCLYIVYSFCYDKLQRFINSSLEVPHTVFCISLTAILILLY